MLPRGGAPILIARTQRGERPHGVIVVSFVGETDLDCTHIYAEAGQEYDWRLLRDLPVLIATRPGIACLPAVREIFEHARPYPTLVDVELQQAASVIDNKPLRLWPMSRSGAAWKELFA